jgi:hypothetical protein
VESVNWIKLAQDKERWPALVNFRVIKRTEILV